MSFINTIVYTTEATRAQGARLARQAMAFITRCKGFGGGIHMIGVSGSIDFLLILRDVVDNRNAEADRETLARRSLIE